MHMGVLAPHKAQMIQAGLRDGKVPFHGSQALIWTLLSHLSLHQHTTTARPLSGTCSSPAISVTHCPSASALSGSPL